GQAAQPRGQVERAASVPVLDGHRLARVQADAYQERNLRLLQRGLHEPRLQVDRRRDRPARRSEHDQCLVASKLQDHPTMVARPGGLSMSTEPSTAATRSTRPRNPDPRAGSAPPTPSSDTSTRSSPPGHSARTTTAVAFAYLDTLARASETTK